MPERFSKDSEASQEQQSIAVKSAAPADVQALTSARTHAVRRSICIAIVFLLLVLVPGILWLFRVPPDPTKLKYKSVTALVEKETLRSEAAAQNDQVRLASPEEGQTPDSANLRFTESGSNDQAKALVEKMLRVNKPWLDPTPVAASYSLRQVKSRTSMDPRRWSKDESANRPFSITPTRLPVAPPPLSTGMDVQTKAEAVSAAQQRLIRVGATLLTPLDYMANDPSSYTLRMLGQTSWGSRTVIGVDVKFNDWIQCRIGMGPHRHGAADAYTWYYGTRELRLLIEPEKSVPLLMIVYTSQGTTKYDPRTATTWEFDPEFYSVDRGLAPRSINWHSNDKYRGVLRQYLKFQVANGIWIFSIDAAVSFPATLICQLLGAWFLISTL